MLLNKIDFSFCATWISFINPYRISREGLYDTPATPELKLRVYGGIQNIL